MEFSGVTGVFGRDTATRFHPRTGFPDGTPTEPRQSERDFVGSGSREGKWFCNAPAPVGISVAPRFGLDNQPFIHDPIVA